MEDLIKNKEILKNIIIFNNLLEEQIGYFCGKWGINFIEFSILSYISNNCTTQYEISKEYEISTQRINQIITKLEKYAYISKTELIRNGKLVKILKITPKLDKKIEEVQNLLIEVAKVKVNSENLKNFSDSLKKLVNELKGADDSIINKKMRKKDVVELV